jgi:hypothetical protein
MTTKEKAVELYNRYEQLGRDFARGVSMKQFAKECALIAVDEILKEYVHAENHIEDIMGKISIYIKYWQEVKQEIEKL